jgi:CRP-like cAMP-binding protein
MSRTIIDELDQVDEAFAGNRLLSSFAAEARALIEPDATVVELQPGDQVLRSGEPVSSSLFPFGPTMVSLGVALGGGRSVEVASVGREGAVGGIISCGHAPAFSSAVVLVGGSALKVPIRTLEDAKRGSGFIANLFCRFSDYLLAQVMQSAACNAFHSIEQRTARWLLFAQDRAGDRIALTQEALAGMLGVQRTTVNAAIRSLEDEALISTGRGVVRVADRAGLKRRACECYDAVERHFDAVIGVGGSGGPDPGSPRA